MKVIGVVAVAALLFAAPFQGTAQTQKPSSQPANKTPPKPVTSGPSTARGGPGLVTLTGCLTESKGEPKGYQLAVSSVSPGATTPTITNYQLVSIPPTVNADSHVGHRVTVTGSRVGAPGAAARGTRGAAASQAVQVRVKEIAMVADSCK
jgi:hypothetical protein